MTAYVIHRRTTFAESDAAGVIHFSRMACYVEEAEHAWLESRGFPIVREGEDSFFWPRVSFQASYHLPLRPMREVTVELHLTAQGTSSLTWAWSILLEDGQLAAEGSMKTVCCRQREGRMEASALPNELLIDL